MKDYEIVENIRDLLLAHAFVGVSVLNTVGGPKHMEIPVTETKDLAQALYFTQRAYNEMVRGSALDDLADDDTEVADVEDTGKEDG